MSTFQPLANPPTGCLLRYKISENYTKPNFSFFFSFLFFLSSDELKVVRSSFLLVISFPLWLDRNLLSGTSPPNYMGGPYVPIFGNMDLSCCFFCCFFSCIGKCCVRYAETIQGLTFSRSNI